MLQKRMFKVIAPMEKKDGGTWWLRCGSGYENRDSSLNLYIEALPTTYKNGPLKLQVRELTEEDLRERNDRSDRRSSYASRGTLGSGLDPTLGMAPPSSTSSADTPF